MAVASAAMWRHHSVHPWVLRVRVLRALPVRARRVLLLPVPRQSIMGLVGDVLAGVPGTAPRLEEAARSPWSRRSTAAIAALAALHMPSLIPTSLPTATSRRARHAHALVLRERGELTAAITTASGRRLRRFRRLLTAELALLAGDVAAPPAGRASGSRVVHVVTNALPDVTAGYTTRTHGIASAQAASGPVTVTTRLGFPIADGKFRAPLLVVQDKVIYQRTIPRRGESRTTLAAARAEAVALAHTARDARVIHAHSHHVNGTIAAAAASALGVPWVYEVRGFLEETWIARGGDPDAEFVRLSRAAETRVMRAADHVVTLSHGMRSEVESRGVDPGRITVVPNAVSASWLEAVDKDQARARLGLPARSLLIGSVSTLNDYEGLDLVAPLVEGLRSLGIDAQGVIVGDGPARATLQAQAADGTVTFAGRVPQSTARDYHAALDVFVVPRLDSSLTRLVTPLKPLEAMATGSLVIASDLAALREVAPEESGAMIVPRDVNAWVQAIAAAASAGEISARGARGQEWVARNRTWEAAARAYSAVYTAAGRRPVD